jgi:hypothetical protein
MNPSNYASFPIISIDTKLYKIYDPQTNYLEFPKYYIKYIGLSYYSLEM